jgi:hypothetical protein
MSGCMLTFKTNCGYMYVPSLGRYLAPEELSSCIMIVFTVHGLFGVICVVASNCNVCFASCFVPCTYRIPRTGRSTSHEVATPAGTQWQTIAFDCKIDSQRSHAANWSSAHQEMCSVMAIPATARWQAIARSHTMSSLLGLSRNKLATHLGNGMHVGVCAAMLLIGALFVEVLDTVQSHGG